MYVLTRLWYILDEAIYLEVRSRDTPHSLLEGIKDLRIAFSVHQLSMTLPALISRTGLGSRYRRYITALHGPPMPADAQFQCRRLRFARDCMHARALSDCVNCGSNAPVVISNHPPNAIPSNPCFGRVWPDKGSGGSRAASGAGPRPPMVAPPHPAVRW
jgi:hypothetical protein